MSGLFWRREEKIRNKNRKLEEREVSGEAVPSLGVRTGLTSQVSVLGGKHSGQGLDPPPPAPTQTRYSVITCPKGRNRAFPEGRH